MREWQEIVESEKRAKRQQEGGGDAILTERAVSYAESGYGLAVGC